MGAESLVWFLIVVAIFGLIIGAIGRLLVPGPTPIGLLGTMGAGVAGAFIGGFLGRVLFGASLSQGWVLVLSVLGAALVVALASGRGRTYYHRRPRRGLMSDRVYDDRVVYDDVDGPYRPVRRRHFF